MDQQQRWNPSSSRRRSPSSHTSRRRDRKYRRRSRSREREHGYSRDLSDDEGRRYRRRRDSKRRSRSGTRRPTSRSTSQHRSDHRRRGRRRSRSHGSSLSYESSASRHETRRNRRHKKDQRRKSSRGHRYQRSLSRNHHRHQGNDEPPRHEPVANHAPARAGIVSDEDGDPTKQHNRKQGHNLLTPLVPVKGSGRAAGAVSEAAHATKLNKPSNKKRSTRSSSHDDTIGHFKGREGTVIVDRYRIEREVGVGTFGRVLECTDLSRRPGRRVAIKIVRNVKRYYESALIEADIVEDVNRRGGRGVTHCAIMYECFTFSGHYCMVFEKLGPSLYDFQKRQNHRPFPLSCVLDFATQLLETLEFLHSFRLVHTDLKPENILLINSREVYYKGHCIPESTRIKLIDFGAATYDNEKKSTVVNTRQYRAPEVILGVGWSMPSDLWSLGKQLVTSPQTLDSRSFTHVVVTIDRLHFGRAVSRGTIVCYPRQHRASGTNRTGSRSFPVANAQTRQEHRHCSRSV